METKIFKYEDPAPKAVERLQARLVAALRRGNRVTVDLDSLPALDNPALRGLIIMLRGARSAGGSLALASKRPDHRRTIRLTALDRLFEVSPC